jgi:MFS family permease
VRRRGADGRRARAPAKARVVRELVQVSVPCALILSTLSFIAVRQLAEAAFLAWGWRIPFLASILLIGVGLYIRLRVLEPPQFQQMKKQRQEVRLPIAHLLRTNWRNLLVGVDSVAAPNIAFYLCTVYAVSYAKSELGMSGSFML